MVQGKPGSTEDAGDSPAGLPAICRREVSMTAKRRLILALIPVAAVALAAACAAPAGGPQHPGHEQGLEILGIQLLAGGDLARLDYKVRDVEKARTALAGDVQLLTAEGRSLTVMSVGRLGPMRQRPSATGKLQFILFTNPGRTLRRGETAILALGEGRISGIPVS
jgi:hypothetical protein